MNAPTRSAETTALAHLQPAPVLTGRDLILQADNLNAMVRVSDLMANSGQAVPRHLRKNPGACFAVTMQAMRWNMDPWALGQQTYTADENGPIAYQGQAIIAALNNSPLLEGRLRFEWGGPWEKIIGRFVWRESTKKTDDSGKPKKYLAKAWDDNEEQGLYCTVSATLAGEREPRTLQLFLMQARVRNSPLWVEDPRQQLAYLASRRWGRLYAPDVIMGVYSPDELPEPGERFMGMVEEVGAPPPPPPPAAKKDALPEFTEAHLKERLVKIAEFYAKGRAADEIIAFYSAKSTLPPAMQDRIRAMDPKKAGEGVQDAAPKVTYAALADRLHKCDDADTAALIVDEGRALPEDQQAELAAIFTSKFQPQG